MKNQKGITLVALVITIVVLIILAGVAINLSIGENGIFSKAKYAVEQHKIMDAKEKLELEIVNIQTNIMEEEGRIATLEDLQRLIDEEKYEIVLKYEELASTEDVGTIPVYAEITVKNTDIIFIVNEKLQVIANKNIEENEEDEKEDEKEENRVEEILSAEIPDINYYISDGLVLHYDAINNTGAGHDSTAQEWKDLSGNGNDGILNEGTWNTNSLYLDGENDFVNCGERNYDNITLELVVMHDENTPDTTSQMLVNIELGGYGLYKAADSYNTMQGYFDSNYVRITAGNKIIKNYIYSLSGIIKDNEMAIYENGLKYYKEITGELGMTQKATVLALGGNPTGSDVVSDRYSGYIYSVRVYNRALTQEEVLNNYEIDKIRFGIEGTTVDEANLNSRIKTIWNGEIATVNASSLEGYILQYSTDKINWSSNEEQNEVTISNLANEDKIYFRLKKDNKVGNIKEYIVSK